MSKYVLLNNNAHKNLKIKEGFSKQLGDSEMATMTFPQEYRSVQNEYPILFKKDVDSGKFYSAVLLGFKEGENLYLTDKGWDAAYVPVSIMRKPFLIGVQPDTTSTDSQSKMLVYVDTESPRLSEDEGQAVFLPLGGYSEYLEKVVSLLEYMVAGTEIGDEFTGYLLKKNLLESVTLDIELRDGSQNQLVGFYTINEDKLRDLDAESLAEMHAKNYLSYIYMALASLSNIPRLIEKKEAQS